MSHSTASSVRQLSPIDALLAAADSSFRTVFAKPVGSRATPQPVVAQDDTQLSDADKALSASLMRVNHVGEVCAQALYASQALGARLFEKDEELARHLEAASAEETDHLQWTAERLEQLGSRPSLLNPLWYAGAFAIGMAAARAGRKISLGFVIETENQVEAHLASHMDRLPAHDLASRAIVDQMKVDEVEHATHAREKGGIDLPMPIRSLMKGAAKVMTTVAHRI